MSSLDKKTNQESTQLKLSLVQPNNLIKCVQRILIFIHTPKLVDIYNIIKYNVKNELIECHCDIDDIKQEIPNAKDIEMRNKYINLFEYLESATCFHKTLYNLKDAIISTIYYLLFFYKINQDKNDFCTLIKMIHKYYPSFFVKHEDINTSELLKELIYLLKDSAKKFADHIFKKYIETCENKIKVYWSENKIDIDSTNDLNNNTIKDDLIKLIDNININKLMLDIKDVFNHINDMLDNICLTKNDLDEFAIYYMKKADSINDTNNIFYMFFTYKPKKEIMSEITTLINNKIHEINDSYMYNITPESTYKRYKKINETDKKKSYINNIALIYAHNKLVSNMYE